MPAPVREPPTRPDMPHTRPDIRRAATLPLPPRRAAAAKGRPGRWRTLANVGPVVAEAMTVNAVLRAFSGYILFLLAFLLRSVNLGTIFDHAVSHNFALGALALGLSVGSLASMVLGSFFRGRAPQLIMFSVLFVAPGGHRAVRLGIRPARGRHRRWPRRSSAPASPSSAQDSIVGREIGDEIRSSTFAVSETLNQVANVAGGLAGVLVSMLNNGQAGLAIAAGGLAVAAGAARACGAGSGSASPSGPSAARAGREHPLGRRARWQKAPSYRAGNLAMSPGTPRSPRSGLRPDRPLRRSAVPPPAAAGPP